MSYQDDEEGVPFDGNPSSFPKDFGYGPFDGDQEIMSSSGDQKPRILLMGLRRKVINTESCIPQNVSK
ncbi:unnamed protein product [Callosobruchus maculatus]|uniref:Uncharacterized protein n=1 Tax=Callosobruchus maculatus TaxID=64391 RepID=A0A653DJJ7_CALMS|nr:unnamed protein product [Callosobruchus maculatus]